MFGVFVSYSEEIKNAYRSIIKDLYTRGLSWAYGETTDDLPIDKIESILDCERMKSMGIS